GEANPDATEEDCAKMNPEEATDPELARALMDLTIIISKPLGGVPWGTYDAEAWDAWGQALVDDGTLTPPVAVSDAWTNEFIDTAHANG
ncbi:MAG: hypothetical protein QGD89_10145, partial [Actinomycetota bacterium]|nr:hypothetical protein [Actinomycetota bacterium]